MMEGNPYPSEPDGMSLSGSQSGGSLDISLVDIGLGFQSEDMPLTQTLNFINPNNPLNNNNINLDAFNEDSFVRSLLSNDMLDEFSAPLPPTTQPITFTPLPPSPFPSLNDEQLRNRLAELSVAESTSWPQALLAPPDPSFVQGSAAPPPTPQDGGGYFTTTSVSSPMIDTLPTIVDAFDGEIPTKQELQQQHEKRKRGGNKASAAAAECKEEQLKPEPRSMAAFFLSNQSILMVPDDGLVITKQPNYSGAPFFLVSYKTKAHKFDLSLPTGLIGKRIQLIVSKKFKNAENAAKKGGKKTTTASKPKSTASKGRGGKGKGKEKEPKEEVAAMEEGEGDSSLDELFTAEIGDPGNKRDGKSISCVRSGRSLSVHFDTLTASGMQIFHIHFMVYEVGATNAPVYVAESIPGLVTSHKTSQHTQALTDLIVNRYKPEEVVSF